MKIKHEDRVVERWVNESIEAAALALGVAHTLVTPQVKQALASRHLLGIFAAQESPNGNKFQLACDALLQAYDT